jgi:hypothetical protein
MHLSIELANDKGTTLETWENHYRLSPVGAEGVSTEVVSALHNGEDVTDKEREAQARREAAARTGGRAPAFAGIEDPFDPAVQQAATVRPLGERKAVDGRDCASFEIRVQKKDGGYEGTVWLELVTGLPVELSYRPTRLPFGVHRMVTTVRYGGPAGEALPVRVEVEGSGAILLLKRTFRSAVVLGGYWRRGSVAAGITPPPGRA